MNMNDLEDEQPDQSVTHGVFIPELPEDHWSLTPSWLLFKASLSEPSPEATELGDWRVHAQPLAGSDA